VILDPKFKLLNDINSLPKSNELISIDTCVILEIWGQHNTHDQSSICEEFIKNTSKNNNILCITTKTFEELTILTQSKTIPRNKFDFNKNPRFYLSNSNNDVADLLNELNKLPNFYPEPVGSINSETLKQITKNQVKHALKWGDSAIYTLNKSEDIHTICTLDGDWSHVDDSALTVLTTQNQIDKFISLKTQNPIIPIKQNILLP